MINKHHYIYKIIYFFSTEFDDQQGQIPWKNLPLHNLLVLQRLKLLAKNLP